jgi:hypothetical protein
MVALQGDLNYMKRVITVGIFSCLMLFFSSTALHAARIPVIFSYKAEKIIKVADFPDTPALEVRGGAHLDAGYLFKQVKLFGIPLWNYEGIWCGYVGSDDNYLKIDKEKLFAMAKAVNVILPENPGLPFWDSIGGKLVVIGLLLLGLAAKFLRSGKNKTA